MALVSINTSGTTQLEVPLAARWWWS
ncbi:uncharacterized protein DNG_00131 [Cephalotrichum gorgonifer]|uniref:Uncharacterized protein n=1 Tax=Cephalotrichum gorgonifer TaxID=2041049 RepID=A0AAE8MQP2_9PEZI|nr:uncharacterized protein DNG_00131 [Cephalotrichum gorgonifer]